MTTPETALDLLDGCTDAEDYFSRLDVPFDRRTLDVNRLHVMQRFGGRVAALPDGAGREQLREALAASYADFTDATALDHRVFKVLRDNAPGAFVPVAELATEPATGTGDAR